MALNAYLRLTGETQGEIRGSVTQQGREDSIEVFAFYHEVIAPRDAASGLPTGRRQHAPLTIVKAIDKSTPLLANLLYRNEKITEFTLRFYRPSRSGQEFQHYTIELAPVGGSGAAVSGIRTEMLNNKYPENMQHSEYERVSFTYTKIIQTWEDGGITADDDWATPVA